MAVRAPRRADAALAARGHPPARTAAGEGGGGLGRSVASKVDSSTQTVDQSTLDRLPTPATAESGDTGRALRGRAPRGVAEGPDLRVGGVLPVGAVMLRAAP